MKNTLTLFAALLLAGPIGLSVEAPRLLSPPDRMEITDVATYFQWLPVTGWTNFAIQIARDAGFADLVKTKQMVNKGFHKNLYFPKDVLPPGSYWWRVRAMVGAQTSSWSEARSIIVNSNHNIAAGVIRDIDAEHPIFLMRNRAWDPAKNSERSKEIIPPGLEHVVVVDDIAMASEKVFERARKYQELGVDFVIWNNRAQVSLATIEFLFQNFSHCIGTAEGEHFWGWEWERGPEGNLSEQDFVRDAWLLCAKYGRFYFQGEGEAARYQWTTIPHDCRDDYLRFHRNIVPMFKSTVGNVALHSLGAVEGLMAAGYTDNCGYWADEFVWGESGFGKTGELEQNPRESLKKFGTKQCPWIYDIQMWLMGIAAGSTVFQLESAHQWKSDGSAAENYSRFFLPFVSAVVKHKLIPSRPAFLESLKIAVECDYERAKQKHESTFAPDFGFLTELYALKHKPFQEIIPDNSRYGIVCLLPDGATNLPHHTRIIPQGEFRDTAHAKEIFAAAYPQRFGGSAFTWECDGTIIVTDSNENLDVAQNFAATLNRGPVRSLKGTVGLHEYLIGKMSRDGNSFWFQANGEFPDREIALTIFCPRKPEIKIEPQNAAITNEWNETAKELHLGLSFRSGAVEAEIK